jgi:hypothetical protein
MANSKLGEEMTNVQHTAWDGATLGRNIWHGLYTTRMAKALLSLLDGVSCKCYMNAMLTKPHIYNVLRFVAPKISLFVTSRHKHQR